VLVNRIFSGATASLRRGGVPTPIYVFVSCLRSDAPVNTAPPLRIIDNDDASVALAMQCVRKSQSG